LGHLIIYLMPYEFSKISSNKTSEREREREMIYSLFKIFSNATTSAERTNAILIMPLNLK